MVDQVPRTYDAGPFLLAVTFPKEHVQQALEYKHQAGDLFVLTYPKNGTTWMQQIVYSILNDGKSLKGSNIFDTFIELRGLSSVARKEPIAIKSHILPDLIWDKTSPDAKYIIVVRNPKDTCVSHYHHTKGFPQFYFTEGKFDVFFDLWIDGKVEYGDYFKWIASAVKHKDEPNVLFMTYESMKKDNELAIQRVAAFLSDATNDYGTRFATDKEYRDRILEHSSVSSMRKKINEDLRKSNAPQGTDHKDMTLEFVRKGQTGDWKTLMTKEQSERMSAKFRQFAEHDPQLMSVWDDYTWL